MRHAQYRFLLLPVFLLLTCIGLHAQANSTMTGIVTDQTGAAVSGAEITLTDPATGFVKTAVTGETGLFQISGLNAANYDLKIISKGFQTYHQTGIVVNVSATVRVDAKLTVGSEATTVTVQADALTVQSDSNVVSSLISEQQITELATNGRNITALATLGLGVSGNLPDMNMPTSVGSSWTISFNGLNQAHNIWLIDGSEAYDRGSGGKSSMMPSQDALSEFQVLASNYPPDYGISSGGTVSMAIKSGTRAFHGGAWEFLRNDAIQAHNYFDNDHGQHNKKPELRMNIFGFNVGGPFFIPKVYNTEKKKTFFFYNQEWRRIIQGGNPGGVHAVPAADFITSASNFEYVLPAYSAAGQSKVFIPYTDNPAYNAKLIAAGLTPPTKNADGSINYQPFPRNIIPGSLIDPAALAYNSVGAIPKANVAGDLLSISPKQPTYVHEEIARVDHNFNDKWQMFAHYIHDGVSQTYATSIWSGDSYPTVGSNFSNPSDSGTIKLTGAIKTNVLAEASINYNSNQINILPSGPAWQKPANYPGQSFFPASLNAKNRLPSVNLNSWGTQFDPWSQPWHNAAQDINEIFGLSITHAKHAMKFGGGYNRYTKNQQLFGNTPGFFTFNDGWDKAHGRPNGTLTGDSYLDFLLGLSTNYAQMENQDIRHYVNQTVSVYAQDNWHMSSRLSVQYGIRYDALPHAWERNNRVASFDPAQYQTGALPYLDKDTGAFCTSGTLTASCVAQGGVSPGLRTFEGNTYYLNGVTIPGQGGTPRGLTKNDYQTYQPRVGFSYDLSGNGKTVIRSGFGTFFERMQGNDIYNVAAVAPFTNTPGVSNVTLVNPYYTWQNGGTLSNTSLPVVPQGPTTIAKNYKAPGVAQYSLGVQHELAPSLVMVAQYVGNTAWHQNIILPINTFPLSTSMADRQKYAAGNMTSREVSMHRNYPGFNNIAQESNLATGNYNSFQLGVRQQDRHGLSFEFDYTYGHEIDSQLGSADLTAVSNPFNIKYDRGSGNLDRRHIVNANYVWKMPFFNTASAMTKAALGGWTLSGTFISQSGLPWAGNNTPGYGGADTVGLGGNYTIHPDMVKKVTYPKKHIGNVYQYVSGDAFQAPVASWLGGPNLGFGNAGRDAVVGPRNTNFSTSLYKQFAFTERTHFEFRAESFNTWNHTQFNNFRNNWSGSDFGQASSARDPRTWQFGGKLEF